MSKKLYKPILKYLLQILLLTVPVVTIVNVILLIVYENQCAIFPFTSPISMLVTYLNYFINWPGLSSDLGALSYLIFIIGELPCILICILYITSFVGVKNKKNRALTYLQYYVIIETAFTKALYAPIYVILCLLLIFRQKYLYANEAD